MSSSVTPQRRRRDDQDVTELDDISVDGEGSSSSTSRNKRVRLDHEAEDHDEEGGNDDQHNSDHDGEPDGDVSEDGPLLPDNYLRSPKRKGRATVQGKHQPGSIVRVKLTDFVTYSAAEFHPGPNLNMIIGPNGTGKSTLVCAICLGLGFKPDHLGRAKQYGEFVKNGTKRAEIEIELAADPEKHTRNPVITTKMNRTDKSPTYAIDGRTTTRKELDRLMRSFYIQIDNLCQFLPQDRVVEFAALSPVNLLAETQRAAAPQEMVDWHEELKARCKEQKAKVQDQQSFMEMVKTLEKRQENQQGDVNRLREHAEAQKRLACLEKLRPFSEYNIAKREFKESKHRRIEAEKELQLLRDQAEPNLRAEESKAAYLGAVQEAVNSKGRLVERAEGNVDKLRREHAAKKEDITAIASKIEGEKKTAKETKQKIPALQQNLRNIQNALANPPAEHDAAAMNAEIREKTREAREVTDQKEEIGTQIGSLNQQKIQQEQNVQRAEAEKLHSQTQAGQQANKLKSISPHSARAWEWIQNNKQRFEGAVFGPPIVECSVTDPRYAAAVEGTLQQTELIAFTVTTSADFAMLNRQIYKEMRLSGVNLRRANLSLDQFKAPCSTNQLQSMGLESWILDLIEGPEPVLSMLCDNRNIHATGFTSGELNSRQLDALKADGSPVATWVTSSDTWQVTRRREYGASSTRSNALRPARYWTDAPASHHEDAALNERIDRANRTINDLIERQDQLKEQFRELAERGKSLQSEEKEIRTRKAQLQTAQQVFAGLGEKQRQAQERLASAQELVRASKNVERGFKAQIDKLTLEKGQKALDYANAVNALRDLHVQHLEAKIISIEAQSDLNQLQERTADERRMLEERDREVEELRRVTLQLKQRGQDTQAVCQRIAPEMEEDNDLCTLYHDEVKDWEPPQLQTEVESVQARLEMNGGSGDMRVIAEFEKRAQDIEKGRSKLAKVEESIEGLRSRIVEIRAQWEPELDGLVSRISDAFADNFSKISCAGEVAVYKDEEDFEQWAIQIKVKFREHEILSILDSHRQSGGERAVSTIFYLMALQSMARAPFRVVDEINQGMDPRNERLVHSRMVDIACSEESASQYFLITPKLLNGLKYHRNMKVHCIASGEFMPSDYRKLDFGMLAAKAREVRGIAG